VARAIWKLGFAILLVFDTCASAGATATATITVTGAEGHRADQSWDVGPLLITISEPNYTFVEAVYYGQYSTPASVASQIAGTFTRDYLQNGLCASTSAVNPTVVTFKLRGTATFGAFRVTSPNTSFQLQGSGFTTYNWTPPVGSGGTIDTTVYMAGGVDHGTYYDSGTLSARVSGAQASVDWSQGSTPSSLASELAFAISTAAGGFVSASASGATVNVVSLTGGPPADATISSSAADTNTAFFSTASFSASTVNMSGGVASEGSLLYSFNIPDQGGYDVNGNVLSVADSVMGQWNYGYDNLNRLSSGSAVTSTAPGIPNTFAGVQPSWSYDAFGNRTAETWGGTGSATVPTSSSAAYAAPNNEISFSSMGTPTYDAAGNVTVDGLNSYLYDAEGRLCAVKNSTGALTGYIYDAAGIRVAKGSLTSFSCSFSSNGYQTTTSWVLGPGGEQVTEYAVSGGTSTWTHTNAFADGKLLATYTNASNGNDTIFALNDWLGTKRGEVGAGGCFSAFTSMQFGNGLSPTSTSNPCPDATEHHFTGKERDSESGNDYFGARYYASSLGRFMSPDWSAKEDPVPYAQLEDPQSLNLYSYVRNNPLARTDPDGHCGPADPFDCVRVLQAVGNAFVSGVKQFLYKGAASMADPTGRSQTIMAVGALGESAIPMPGGEEEESLATTNASVIRTATTEVEEEAPLATQAVRTPGPTVDPNTGAKVGRFIVDPKGNTMIEPEGGSTVSAGKGGVDTHTTYPNGSNYQRLNPQGHSTNPTPHGHGHLPGTGQYTKGQGSSISTSGKVVNPKSADAHWPIL
jgi:RHS repeat-associated protein